MVSVKPSTYSPRRNPEFSSSSCPSPEMFVQTTFPVPVFKQRSIWNLPSPKENQELLASFSAFVERNVEYLQQQQSMFTMEVLAQGDPFELSASTLPPLHSFCGYSKAMHSFGTISSNTCVSSWRTIHSGHDRGSVHEFSPDVQLSGSALPETERDFVHDQAVSQQSHPISESDHFKICVVPANQFPIVQILEWIPKTRGTTFRKRQL
uniref:Uncharacterized protein n=2 Tax=Percolomonas cosmopolitus TaxID=63605 RepID=A0A7S1KTJ9_9EUKA